MQYSTSICRHNENQNLLSAKIGGDKFTIAHTTAAMSSILLSMVLEILPRNILNVFIRWIALSTCILDFAILVFSIASADVNCGLSKIGGRYSLIPLRRKMNNELKT